MHLKKTIILLTLIFQVTYSFACSCTYTKNITEKAKTHYKNSKVVFSGYIIAKNNESNCYIVYVKEVFKGTINKGQIIRLYDTDCEPYPKIGKTWLMYLDFEYGNYYIAKCGISRDIIHPEDSYLYNQYNKKIPYPGKSIPEETANEKMLRIIETRRKAITDLRNEIEWLRIKQKSA